jgi:uncharacterized membrane protein (DUF4010 family)
VAGVASAHEDDGAAGGGRVVVDEVIARNAVRLAIALGIGLLVGAERERRMAERGSRGSAGVRTFALVAVLGGLAEQVGGGLVLAVTLAFVGGAALIGYARDRALGITSEVALVVTFLLGVLAQREPALAAGLGVGVTIVLATRTALHRFVASVLTAQEVHDALLLAAAALVVLPLLPDRSIGPGGAVSPFAVWRLVVLLMAISGAGYIAVRAAGPRFGLGIAGLLGGFVSSTATTGAMGARTRAQPELQRAAISAALLSTVATFVQLGAVVAATSREALRELAWPLALGGAGAVAAAGLALIGTRRAPVPNDPVEYGRAFELRTALLLGLTITAVTVVSAAASELAGEGGVRVVALLGGFADTHAAAIGVASLVAAGQLAAAGAPLAVLAALSANTASKVAFAFVAGGVRFAAPVGVGLVLALALAWLGTLLPAL